MNTKTELQQALTDLRNGTFIKRAVKLRHVVSAFRRPSRSG
jgi:hypothetical protein